MPITRLIHSLTSDIEQGRHDALYAAYQLNLVDWNCYMNIRNLLCCFGGDDEWYL